MAATDAVNIRERARPGREHTPVTASTFRWWTGVQCVFDWPPPIKATVSESFMPIRPKLSRMVGAFGTRPNRLPHEYAPVPVHIDTEASASARQHLLPISPSCECRTLLTAACSRSRSPAGLPAVI